MLVEGLSEAGDGMHVVSIEDPANPTVVSVVETTSHTWTCVTDVPTGNGCGWAYGRGTAQKAGTAQIIDLREPASPELLSEGWRQAIGDGGLYIHDLTEIRPGLVMTAGEKPALMDTTDAARPELLVRIDADDHEGFPIGRTFPSLGYHSVEWARGGADDFLVMGTEIAPSTAAPLDATGSDCEGENSVIETWDARAVRDAVTEYERLRDVDGVSRPAAATLVFGEDRDAVNFHLVDFFDASGQGNYREGKALTHVLYCAHWMEVDPSWENGGRLVVGYYNRGVRFVDVPAFDANDESEMEEIGWFLGADAYTGSAQWVTDTIVYVSDYARGLDIVEIDPQAEMTGYYTADSSLADRELTMARLDEFGIAPPVENDAPHGVLTITRTALAAAAVLRRRVTA